MQVHKLLNIVALSLGLGTFTVLAAAQSFPTKPIRVIVPFPAGAATDQLARLFAQRMQGSLGQPLVIDNKPGGGGSIAAMEVIRSNPDGYTLLFSSNSAISSNVALLKNVPYDPNKDFSSISPIGDTVLVLMVKPSFPAKNLEEFVAYAKKNPGKINGGYGSSATQLSIAILNKLGGIDTAAIPYKGIPPAITDVLGGTIDYTFVDLTNAINFGKSGALRPIGVTGAKRSPVVPTWPTMSEVLPGFDITAWFGIVGPAGIPKETVAKLHRATQEALTEPETKDKVLGMGVAPVSMTPDQFQAFIGTEIVRWNRLVKDAGIQPE